jgi:alpha-glucosidase (family GH31 glycosyl hydrolase)
MLMNSNGIDAVLEQDSLTFKAIGGVIDLYIFSGSSPADVVKQYTNVVGKPMMPAYWSLGFHNCKYGYSNISEVESVVKGYQEAQIPLDTQWFDIDYMQSWRDFTYDSLNFPVAQVKSFVDNLHTQGMHFVPIIDPGIEEIDNYTPYQDGIDSGIYVKDLNGDKPYLGQVWPGPVGFPDWFNPKTSNYWYTQLNKWWDMANFDGLWIDMNEVSNFCNEDGTAQVCENTNTNCPTGNLDTQTTCCLSCQQVDASNQYDFPPYRIHNQQSNGNLGSKTMAPSSIHYDNMIDYNVHNLYGLGEQIATYEALTTIRKERPFLLTRSSFLSSGAHTAKWTGDNAATWDDLRSSIVSIMDFSLFGIPMLGADICGFLGDTTEELCSRWIEVGAFYLFSRNHNSLGQKPQELYLWDTVKVSAQKALGIRYQILPYLYTLFYKANTSGDTVTRALWMNFPNDVQASKINYQFMLGKAIMVSPVVYEGATSVDAYFPQNYWYDFESLNVIDASSSGMTKTLDTPLSNVNVHIKGGNILPLQGEAMTTTEARTKPYSLIVALCDKGKAWGDLFIDDGISTDLTKSLQIAYEATLHSLTATITEHSYKGADSLLIERITIISPQISIIDRDDIKLNGVAVDPLSVSSAEGKLYLLMDSLTINKPFTLTW